MNINFLSNSSCYSISVIGYMEWALCREHGNIITPLSPQYIVSCGRQYREETGNVARLNGCDNGSSKSAIDFISDYGLELEKNFEYRDDELQCPIATATSKKKKGYIRPNVSKAIRLNSRTKNLDLALKLGPLIVSMNIPNDFVHYGGGIIESCDQGTGHSMLVVGSATEDGVSYLIIKNSFGYGWGYDGYLKLSRAAIPNCVKEFISPVINFPSPKSQARRIKAYFASRDQVGSKSINDIESEEPYSNSLYRS